MTLRFWLPGALLLASAVCPVIAQSPQPPSTPSQAAPSEADPLVHRLVLKDGNYQNIRKYEIRGDRVRYISSERGGDDWEELPLSLVDWAATEKYAHQHAADGSGQRTQAQQEQAEIDAEEKADRNRDLEVAPDLRLPDETGVWVLDTYRDGPELAELQQDGANINQAVAHNIVRSSIGANGMTKQTIEASGRHAKAFVHVSQPVFYMSVDADADEPGSDALTVDTHGAASEPKKTESGSAATSKYIIVRVEVRKDYRFIGFVRPAGPDPNVIPLKAELLPGGHWMKLSTPFPLQAGDYALMEVLSPGQVNLGVWGFKLDPNAPDTEHAILPLQRALQR